MNILKNENRPWGLFHNYYFLFHNIESMSKVFRNVVELIINERNSQSKRGSVFAVANCAAIKDRKTSASRRERCTRLYLPLDTNRNSVARGEVALRLSHHHFQGDASMDGQQRVLGCACDRRSLRSSLWEQAQTGITTVFAEKTPKVPMHRFELCKKYLRKRLCWKEPHV